MGELMNRNVPLDGNELVYSLEYKDVKNINLRILRDCSIRVSANRQVSPEQVDMFVQSKSDFILRAIGRFQEIEKNRPHPKQYVSGETFYLQGRSIRLNVVQDTRNAVTCDGIYIHLHVKDKDDFVQKQRLITRFLDKESKAVYTEILEELYPAFQKYGVAMPILRIRDMDTRWGSCLVSKGIITINKRLIAAPRVCIEYVVMHELCHFIQPNHSKRFYGFLTMMMPDWMDRKALLEKLYI